MELSKWVILAIIILIGILVVVGVIMMASKSSTEGQTDDTTISELLAKYKNPNTWNSSSAGPDEKRNICRLYTFTGSMDSDGTAVPGQATFNRQVIDTLTPSDPPICIDSDQVVVSQRQHTCQGESSSASFCVRFDGTRASPGETEIYYDNSRCPTGPCVGTLGLIGLDGQVIGADDFRGCISTTPTGEMFVRPCNVGDETQLFRVTRKELGAAEPTPGTYSTGPVGRIVHRSTGLCVSPLNDDSSSRDITLKPCSPSTEYIWGFIPSITVPNSIIPQRIAYIGNLDPSTIPLGNPQDFAQYAVDNKIRIISAIIPFTDFTAPTRVTLNPYVIENNITLMTKAQFYNYFLYNVVKSQDTPF